MLGCDQENVADGPAQRSITDLEGQSFNLAEPSNIQSSIFLWGTYYYIPVYRSVVGGHPLYDTAGNHLGVELSEHDWCYGALEGTFQVQDGNSSRVYNYIKSMGMPQVNCLSYFSYNVSASRFAAAQGKYGDGVQNFKLVPYRTIAVDSKYIPYGTVIYIPSARGTRIILDNGQSVEHDGYFFAADTGGALKSDHIDVFLGRTTRNPFDWIQSNANRKVKAFVVKDTQIIKFLRKIHQ